jgi:hypothetical protein
MPQALQLIPFFGIHFSLSAWQSRFLKTVSADIGAPWFDVTPSLPGSKASRMATVYLEKDLPTTAKSKWGVS